MLVQLSSFLSLNTLVALSEFSTTNGAFSMKRFKLFTLLSPLVLFASCTSSGPSSAVDDYCKCADPLHKKAAEMMSAMQKGDFAGMQSMTQDMQAMSKDLEACMSKLTTKYDSKKDDPEFKSAVMKGIDEKCPNPAKKMAEGMMGMGMNR
jgi:Skp family chaperone for outer membrane proteins